MNGLPLFYFLCGGMNFPLTSRIFPDSLDECFTIFLHLELTDSADKPEGFKGGWLHPGQLMQTLVGKDDVWRITLLVGEILTDLTQIFEEILVFYARHLFLENHTLGMNHRDAVAAC